MATNVVASWPPERRPTGTPHARANTGVHDNKHQWGMNDLTLSDLGVYNVIHFQTVGKF